MSPSPRRPALPLRVFPDPVLRTPSIPVEAFDATVLRLVGQMLDELYARGGVGLAGVQVGVRRRLFVYDIGDGPGVAINPEILGAEGEVVGQEGCLSLPGLWVEVCRAERISVAFQRVDGHRVEEVVGGYLARVFQHEIDHLDGRLVFERLEGGARRAALRELRGQLVPTPTSR